MPPLNAPAASVWRRLLCGFILLPGAVLAGWAQNPASPPAESAAQVRAAVASDGAHFTPSVYKTFAEWKAACQAVPSNRSLKFTPPPAAVLPLKSFNLFTEVLQAFFNLSKNGPLAQKTAWLGPIPVQSDFFNTDGTYFLRPQLLFQPFVERDLVPAGSEVLFHGDMHGDIHALVAWLDWLNQNGYLKDFRIARPNVYMVFLGDYTDRGMYGTEVLYTMLRLKVENPDHVLIVRGNHEDVSLAARYGFIAEGRAKYGRDFDAKRVMRLYDFLPVVLYLGCETNAIQCNHGGMEPGFNPRNLLDAPEGARFQLLGKLNQQQFLKDHPDLARGLTGQARQLMQNGLLDFQPQSPTEPVVIGFMWNDFSVVRGEPQFDFDPGRAFIYGEGPTKYLLDQFSGTRRLQAVFRAHQHATIMNAMMRRLKAGHGIYRHWQETDSTRLSTAELPVISQTIEVSDERHVPSQSVWTFNVVPDSVYGEACDYAFDTFGILKTAQQLDDWRLRVVNTKPK
jgi:hypothetical protein